MEVSKNNKIISLLALIVFLFFTIGPDLRFGPDFRLSTKVIDPDQSGFDPLAFQFEDYNTYKDSVYALSKMFPPGTSRADIESIITNQNNYIRSTPPIKYEDKTSYGYDLKRPHFFTGWYCLSKEDAFGGDFDPQDRLIEFYVRSCGLWQSKTITKNMTIWGE